MTSTTESSVKSQHPGAGASRPAARRLRVWSTALCLWSVAYLLPHLYWALGGDTGFSVVKPSASTGAEWRLANWSATAVLALAVLISIAFVHLARHGAVLAALLAASLIGAAVAASHGVYGIIYRTLNVVGVIEIDGRGFELPQHRWVLWDLLVFEPWFLIEGILFAAVGWAALVTTKARRRWAIACSGVLVLATATGVLGVRVG